MEHFPDYPPVVVALVDYPDLAAESSHVVQYVHRAGLTYGELEIQRAEILNHLNERLYRKGIMLRGNSEFPLCAAAPAVLLVQQLVLLVDLTHVHQKIRALSGDGNSPAAPDENLYPYFLFKLPDRACKRRLRDKKLLRRLVHRALLRYCQRVLHLLQCHSVSPVNVFMLRL